MTKIFDKSSIILVNDMVVVVDRPILDGDYHIAKGQLVRTGGDIIQYRDIIATLYKRLEGVPLIKLPNAKDLAEKAALVRYGTIKESNSVESKKKMFGRLEYYEGYSDALVAQADKKFTEEDLKQATWAGHQFRLSQQYEHNQKSFVEWYPNWFHKEHTQPLRVPTSISLPIKYPYHSQDGSQLLDKVDIDIETNTIIPVEVSYDN